jgi:hypothetical protein
MAINGEPRQVRGEGAGLDPEKHGYSCREKVGAEKSEIDNCMSPVVTPATTVQMGFFRPTLAS